MSRRGFTPLENQGHIVGQSARPMRRIVALAATRNKSNFLTGFTLIELLVVIAIIGLLSSVVLASLNSARAKARDAKRVSEVSQLKIALEFYYDKNNDSYPPAIGTWPNDCGGSTSLDTALSGLVSQGFISKIPKDPKNPSPWPQCYYYESNESCLVGGPVHPYIIIFQAENPLEGYTSWHNETNRYCTYP